MRILEQIGANRFRSVRVDSLATIWKCPPVAARYLDLFAVLVCAAAAMDIAYQRLHVWDIPLVAGLSLTAGYLLAGFLGLSRIDK